MIKPDWADLKAKEVLKYTPFEYGDHKRECHSAVAAALRDEREQWKHCYDLRGQALQKPCLKCGYVSQEVHERANR